MCISKAIALIHTHTHTHTCTHTCTHILTHTHTYTQIFTHTYSLSLSLSLSLSHTHVMCRRLHSHRWFNSSALALLVSKNLLSQNWSVYIHSYSYIPFSNLTFFCRTPSNQIQRNPSIQRKSSAEIQRVPSSGSAVFQRAPSFGRVSSASRPVLDLSTVAVVGKHIQSHLNVVIYSKLKARTRRSLFTATWHKQPTRSSVDKRHKRHELKENECLLRTHSTVVSIWLSVVSIWLSGVGFLRIPGKAANSWSISADGRVHPDIEGAGKFDGLVPGSIIQVGSSQFIDVCVCESAHVRYC